MFVALFVVQAVLAVVGTVGLLRHTSGRALLAALVRRGSTASCWPSPCRRR